MEQQILELRQNGKTYKEICEILNCAKSTVSYYCGKQQKEKTGIRNRRRRSKLCILHKVVNFQYDRKLKDKTDDFQRERIGRSKLGKRELSFSWQDVINKFGWETKCYLTGRHINLREPKTYHFDHIVSKSKGGKNTLDNLGICCREANMAKSNLSVEELIILCKEILSHSKISL